MATASSAERYAGDHCKKLGLFINQFYPASQVMTAVLVTRLQSRPLEYTILVRLVKASPLSDSDVLPPRSIRLRRGAKQQDLLFEQVTLKNLRRLFQVRSYIALRLC